jgi:hypothetical protein
MSFTLDEQLAHDASAVRRGAWLGATRHQVEARIAPGGGNRHNVFSSPGQEARDRGVAGEVDREDFAK